MKRLLYSAVAGILPFLLLTKNKQHFSILTYHRVLPQFDDMRPLETTLPEFEWQMELISTYCNPLSLRDALRLLAVGELPPRAVCVTFDDGYSDNETTALPILQSLGVPATVFVSVGFLNGGRMWNDSVIEAVRLAKGATLDLTAIGLEEYSIDGREQRQKTAGSILQKIKHWPQDKRAIAVTAIESIDLDGELPSNLMMTDAQLLHLSEEGIEIGAHTLSHPILATLGYDEALAEIADSKYTLEEKLGGTVDMFAYPNGKPGIDYTAEHRDMVEKLGFSLAVSTKWGVASHSSDRWQLPRFTPWDKTPLRFMLRLLLNFRNSA
jgi:peptidoglycan/xylan/chitin deacetylase (PgdA/CDA1 family)